MNLRSLRLAAALAAAALSVPKAAALDSFWIAGVTSDGRLQVAQGARKGKKVTFAHDVRIGRTAVKAPSKVVVKNSCKHKIKVFYYRATDKVLAVHDGFVVIGAGKSKTLPGTAHRVKVFKPALFDKHLGTSGAHGGTITVRPSGKKVKFSGGKVPRSTMNFRNTTEQRIKVCVYDGADAVQIIPKHVQFLDPGASGSWKVAKGTHHVKIFSPALLDRPLVDGTYPFNSTLTISETRFADTGLVLSGDQRAISSPGYLCHDGDIDGAPIHAATHLMAYSGGTIVGARQTAKAHFPFRFAQGATFGWGDDVRTGIAAADHVGAPAIAVLDVQVGHQIDVPQDQMFAFAVTRDGALVRRELLEWASRVSISNWRTHGDWTPIVESGVTHVTVTAERVGGSDTLYVVHRKADGRLYGGRFSPDAPEIDWEALGDERFQGAAVANFRSETSKTSVFGGGTLVERNELFAVRSDGALMTCRREGESGAWTEWESIRRDCTGTPDFEDGPRGTSILVVRTKTGGYSVSRRDGGEWGSWVGVGGTFVSSPVIYSFM